MESSRKRCFSLLVAMIQFANCAPKRDQPSQTLLADWSREILHGITEVPYIGSPVRLVVYGETSEAILTGDQVEDVLMAAAQLGKGRIVVISDRRYFTMIRGNQSSEDPVLRKLHANVIKWLTNGSCNSDECVATASAAKTALELQKHYKLILWDGGKAVLPSETVTDFIKQGGSFIFEVTTWYWLASNPGKMVKDIPYYDLLASVGITLTRDIIESVSKVFPVGQNKAAEANLGRMIRESGKNLSQIILKINWFEGIKWIPDLEGAGLAGSVESIFRECDSFVHQNPPTSGKPVRGSRDVTVFRLWLLIARVMNKISKAPGIDSFPGDFSAGLTLAVNKTVRVTSLMSEWHLTGCYAPAGRTIGIEILSGNDNGKWKIMIGAHTDSLFGTDTIKRWPVISSVSELNYVTGTKLWSPFGGLIYLESPSGVSQVTVRFMNIVESPNFKLDKRSVWASNRLLPGLWADISSRFLTITLPSSAIRNLEDPTKVMEGWDRLLVLYHELRGTNVTSHRRTRIVTDLQASAGYMHSGHPIVTHLDVADPNEPQKFLLDSSLFHKCSWGIFHEIGHNMQQGPWTFDGTVEVTTNIFVLYAYDVICRESPWIHPWLKKSLPKAITYLESGADFNVWMSDASVALFVYAQLAREFGWGAYKSVFRRYQSEPELKRKMTNQEKIDTWFVRFSETTGYDLTPIAMFWGIPVSPSAISGLAESKLRPFLLDDDVTRASVNRTSEVLRVYPGVLRKIAHPMDTSTSNSNILRLYIACLRAIITVIMFF